MTVAVEILDARFMGDEYNTLVAWLNTPAEKANGLSEDNRKWFPGQLKRFREELVTATVLETIDKLRGVDGILVAEALAGSPRQGQILDLYRPFWNFIKNIFISYRRVEPDQSLANVAVCIYSQLRSFFVFGSGSND